MALIDIFLYTQNWNTWSEFIMPG